MSCACLPRRIAFAVSVLVLLPGTADSSPPATARAAPLTGISVSFKLDPRLIDPTHGGRIWISPKTYSGANAQDTVEARAQGVDAQGRLSAIRASWTASDPEMVKLSSSQGSEVRIVVTRAGESSVNVVSGGASQVLAVRARYQGEFIQVAITQLRDPKPRPAPTKKVPGPESTLAEKKSDGDLTLPGGLRYRILEKGHGPKPTEDDVVECRYRLIAPDGKHVEGSDASGQPATFSVAKARWKEALKLMPVGSRWRIVVPPQPVAKGDRPRGRKRSASTVRRTMPMVIEVELLAIQRAPGGGQRAAAASGPAAAPGN